MTKLKPAYSCLAVGVALIMGWFYWYEYRPEQIRKECAAIMTEIAAKAGSSKGLSTYQNMCADAGGIANFRDAFQKGMREKVD
jgi:hypothetical protein